MSHGVSFHSIHRSMLLAGRGDLGASCAGRSHDGRNFTRLGTLMRCRHCPNVKDDWLRAGPRRRRRIGGSVLPPVEP